MESLLLRPALLAAFLGEIIMNSFSPDTVQYVLNRIDLHMPGEREPLDADYSKFWRQSLWGEVSV